MQTPENLAATLYETLGIPRHATWTDIDGRPHKLYHGLPIPGLTVRTSPPGSPPRSLRSQCACQPAAGRPATSAASSSPMSSDLLGAQAELLFHRAVKPRLRLGKADFRGNEDVPAFMQRRMVAADGPQAAVEV